MVEKQYDLAKFHLGNFLDEVVAKSEELRSKVVAANHKGTILSVHLQGTITVQDDQDLHDVVNNHNFTPPSKFLIMDLVNTDFKGLPLENIDFKRHLPGDIALDKHIVMMPNGRPSKSQYLWEEQVIAEIRFTFQEQNYLLTEKCEHLYYKREDGSWSEGILIGKRTYDHTDLVDGSIVVEERIQARTHIVSSMKAFLSGVIMQGLGKSIDEVIVMITPFWDSSYEERKKFIEFGTNEWKNYLANVDLSQNPTVGSPEFLAMVADGTIKDSPYPYLGIPIDENGTTVRDYMVGRLTY